MKTETVLKLRVSFLPFVGIALAHIFLPRIYAAWPARIFFLSAYICVNPWLIFLKEKMEGLVARGYGVSPSARTGRWEKPSFRSGTFAEVNGLEK